MMKNKACAIMLSLCMLFSLSSCGTKTDQTPSLVSSTEILRTTSPAEKPQTPSPTVIPQTPSPATTALPDEDSAEFQQAVDLGIVPDGMQAQGDVSASELFTLLSNVIQARSGSLTPTWENYSANQTDKTVTRSDAALAIYYAGNALGFTTPNYDLGFSAVDSPDGIIWDSALFQDWEQTISIKEGDSNSEFPKLMWAQIFVCNQMDLQHNKPVMEIDKENKFNFTRNMTRLDAIKAAYRLYLSIDESPEYVTLDQTGENTIPKELLDKPSTLPEVSNQKIPAYKGYYIQNKETTIWPGMETRKFQEREIKFLSDNGFNFVNVHLGFSTLSYPDFPKGQVNLNELKDLDQLIAWGIKYNVHVCIAMDGRPGVSVKDIQDLLSTNRPNNLFSESKELEVYHFATSKPKDEELVKEYWTMLAKRYANIPAKNLSFLLITEPDVQSDAEYTRIFSPVVDAIWQQNPNRVIFSYSSSNGILLEGLAKKGCAMAWSSYFPPMLNYYLADGIPDNSKRYPYLEQPQWPMLYLPTTFYGGEESRRSLVINGNFKEGTVGIVLDKENMDSKSPDILSILADGVQVLSQQIKGTDPEEVVASIPDGTKNITIEVNESGWLQYSRIKVTQSGKQDIIMFPHDLGWSEADAAMPVLNVDDNGVVSNTDEALTLNFDYIFNQDIRETAELAEKYNVGYMLLEWGPFGKISDNSRMAYEEMMLAGFKKLGIGWCHQSLIRDDGILLTRGQYLSMLSNGNAEEGKYLPLEDDNFYYINSPLLTMYRRYTVEQ
jgi:hypothetical protein